MSENEINKVHVLIRRFLYETDEILHDAKACQQWLISFCKTLQFQDLCKNPNDYALLLLKEAKEFNRQQQLKAQKKQVRKVLKEQGVANPTKEEINAKWLELFGQEDLTAGAPNVNNGDESATACDHFEAQQSQNATEDAATCEGAVNMTRTSNGATLESGTSSVAKFNDKNMRRVPQNEAPTHGFSGGRTAQGTMSRSPEAAAQSGKVYDQETDQISTNDGRRTGVPSLSQTSPLAPVRHSSTAKSGDVLSMAYSGEFSNVKLTQEQYNELGIKFGNLQKLNRAIDSLSCKLENDEITPRPKNHYAVLVKWASYRDDMEEKKELEESKPKMTNMEKSWIAAMKRVEEM